MQHHHWQKQSPQNTKHISISFDACTNFNGVPLTISPNAPAHTRMAKFLLQMSNNLSLYRYSLINNKLNDCRAGFLAFVYFMHNRIHTWSFCSMPMNAHVLNCFQVILLVLPIVDYVSLLGLCLGLKFHTDDAESKKMSNSFRTINWKYNWHGNMSVCMDWSVNFGFSSENILVRMCVLSPNIKSGCSWYTDTYQLRQFPVKRW